MAKFRYKMQSILDVKEKLENKAKQDFAQANARLDAEKVKLVELQKRRSYYMEEGLRLRLEKIDIRKIRENKMAVLKMDEYIKNQMVQINLASREVEKAYLKVLTDGTDSYQADGTEIYMSTELNMVDKSMKEIFGLSEGTQASPELSELSDDERQTLYNETMKFFEKLYGESSETYNAEDAENTESAE